jgi:hypothetical protein
MKRDEYKKLLEAVEKALHICDHSTGFMDAVHQKICDDLREARNMLRNVIGASGSA